MVEADGRRHLKAVAPECEAAWLVLSDRSHAAAVDRRYSDRCFRV
jgi:hypothetical protein